MEAGGHGGPKSQKFEDGGRVGSARGGPGWDLELCLGRCPARAHPRGPVLGERTEQ